MNGSFTEGIPADLFQIDRRGYIREGYYADLVLVSPQQWQVDKSSILYKCGWSPLEGQDFSYKVINTFVNGHLAFDGTTVLGDKKGMALYFNR